MSGEALPVLTLYRLGKLVAAGLDLSSTLDAIVSAAHQLIPSESTRILLLEREDLVLRAMQGAVGKPLGEQAPVGTGVMGRALREMRALRADGMLVAPLVWRGVALGVLTASSLSPGLYGEVDLELASELADKAAECVAHARADAEHLAQLEALQHALAHAEQRLLQTEKLAALGQLACGIAHELNTPLGVIISNLSVLVGYGDSLGRLALLSSETALELRRESPESTIVDALEAGLRAADLDYMLADLPTLIIESTASANRIADLVRSVSIFAQDAAGLMGPVSIEDALEVGLTLASTETKHRVHVQRAFAGVPTVLGNASELTQVVVHLLLNAAQATDERGGRVWVTTAFENGEVIACIADEGRGIRSGLGLTMCQSIMARHGGTIDVQTGPGAGTRVTLSLVPYVAPASVSPPRLESVEVAK